jgi:septal ring factor EnvC (AmiA/AmiB activator)
MIRALAACFLALVVAARAAAQGGASGAEELARIEKRLEDRAADEKRLRNEAAEREKEVAEIRFRMVETANALQESERRLGEISELIERLAGEESTLAEKLAYEQSNVGDVLAALLSLEMARPPAILVSPEDANEAARAAILLAGAAPELEAKAQALREDLERLAAIRAERDRERLAFENTRAQVFARRQVLADLLKKKQGERDVAARLAAAAQRETAALASRATNLRDVVRRLERLARSITPRLKPRRPEAGDSAPRAAPASPNLRPDRFAPARPFAEARGALKPPVVGRIAGAFGSRLPDGGRLDGMRFAAPDQAVVTAPFEGSVAYARAWDPIGKLIVLDVGGGYHLLFMGVSMILAQEGQKVAAGEPIASMTAAPGEKEARLDLQIRKDGEPVNPALWLSRKSVEEMRF